MNVLRAVIAAVEEEGAKLAAELYLPEGPRGRRGHAPIDTEIEERLRAKLQALVGCPFTGEETGVAPGRDAARADWLWLVDPHDGTFDFIQGKRGSSISVALLRACVPVLGVVHSPCAPDRGADTVAWAEGAPLTRNGAPVKADLARRRLEPGEFIWTNSGSALRPETFSRAALPARYVAMPSIAYRLARVAAGDGAAALTVHGINEYDSAAGLALVQAAGGVLLDAQGREVVLTGKPEARVEGCFAGSREAAGRLCSFPWGELEQEPKKPVRVHLGYPRKADEARVARAAGCLLGQVIGDSLGSRVEFKGAAEIAREFPQGVRELADGGVYRLIAGQPTDDSEMALALARSLVRHRGFVRDEVLAAYRAWLQSRPVDVGATTERGLLGLHTTESESNGSLMRVSPIGVWAAGDPARAAATAREDSALTHPNPVCVEACAGYSAAIAAGVAGAGREAMRDAALAHCAGRAREAIAQGAGGKPHAEYEKQIGWVLIALQNAFYCLFRPGSVEEALVETVGRGGDTDTNAAIAGALMGAAFGREAFASRWVLPVLACRPMAEAGALRPRPVECWPDDLLELAEALLNT
ncbi:MAG TPA: inositol monophosphatase family protein [Burkholderiales bacterium]|nr:inositol monophosphatase family protein [Burkholderiales bacterium]